MGGRRGEDRRRRPPDRAREGHPRGLDVAPGSSGRPPAVVELDRRTFLAGLSFAAACADADPSVRACGPSGRRVGLRPVVGEELSLPLEERVSDGLDARYAVDLATLEADGLVLPAERFYLRTGAPLDLGDPAAWTVRLAGLVAAEVLLALDELLALAQPIGVAQWECSGNGSNSAFGLMSAGDFAGVPLVDVLARVTPLAGAVAVRIVGHDSHPPSTHSDPGASWVFRPEELDGAWLVTHQDGEPIPLDHGRPVRLLVPGWYGCCDIKWVDEIAWVADDEPATAQMREFAARTAQDGVPDLARDYAPAEMGVSAVVARVEEWETDDGERALVAVGVVWGGRAPARGLRLWMGDDDLGPVEICRRDDVATWGLWASALPSDAEGARVLRLTLDDDQPAPRLVARYYDRTFDLG